MELDYFRKIKYHRDERQKSVLTSEGEEISGGLEDILEGSSNSNVGLESLSTNPKIHSLRNFRESPRGKMSAIKLPTT
jgi:hypothetical protein